MLARLVAFAAESAADDQNLFLVVLVASGPLVGAAAVVWAQIWAHGKERKAEEDRYWRTARHEAYADLVGGLTEVINSLQTNGDVSPAAEAHVDAASHKAALIARPDLYETIQHSMMALDALKARGGIPGPIPAEDDGWHSVLVLMTAMRDEIRMELEVPPLIPEEAEEEG